MDELPLITTIAVAFTAAWLLGLVTQRLGLSPIVGYLLAGILIGPHTPGFHGDVHLAQQLAEVGVILLMFGVGLHFHLRDLLAVKAIAIPGAIGQSAIATLLGVVIFSALGETTMTGAVFGMAMAVASTVVLMRVLTDADALDTPQGHVAVGWLLVEDVFTVVLLVMVPVLGDSASGNSENGSPLWWAVALALLKLAVFVAVALIAGPRVIPWVLVQVARLRSRELFTLTVLVFSIAIATAAYAVFGASMALGAFLAGMLVALSPVSHQAAADALPLRDAFAVLFFVSVGMLFDPQFILEQPGMVLAALAIILAVKPLAAIVVIALLGHSARTALTVAVGLAQIGEFSFILSDLAQKHGLLPPSAHNVLVAAAMISITINPLLFRSLPRLERWLKGRAGLWWLLNARAERKAGALNSQATQPQPSSSEQSAIVVGFGPVGRSVHRILTEAGLTPAVIDMNMDTVLELKRQGRLAVFGDASRESILEQAGMRRASHLILTLPHSSARLAVVTAARNINPAARILVRAHYLSEQDDLESAGATAAVFEEAEAAVALARLVLTSTGAEPEVMEEKIRDLRLQLILENMSNFRSQRVRNVMVPWNNVHRLLTSATRHEVLQQVVEQRFSRWPVMEANGGKVTGYLLAMDLISEDSSGSPWLELIRPVHVVRPDDNIDSVLLQMQSEGLALCIVEDAGVPVGLISIEDILEQVVGRIEDEYPHEKEVGLRNAVLAGGVVLSLSSRTVEDAIRELASSIPEGTGMSADQVATLAIARERQISTDLGGGVAIPHARPEKLIAPLIVVGRSRDGIEFSSQSHEPVRLLFLLVTPLNEPDLQLSMVARLALFAADRTWREELLQAASTDEIVQTIAKADSVGVVLPKTNRNLA